MLAVAGVRKSYVEGDRAHAVLQGASLAVAPGETVAIVGKSGTGKTSLLHAIGGLDPVDAGTIRVGDFDVTRADATALAHYRRARLGFVFQFFNLLPYLTAFENVSVPLRMLGGWDAAAGENARELCARLGIADRLDALPERLSGGERQRVAIARALVHAPALVLADEPTGNLDEANTRSVADVLFPLVRERGTMMVLVTHDPAVAARADRTLRLHEGRLC